MAIINRLPKGFLSFLDQQTQGQNPQEPQPGLFLTSDLDAFYRAQEIVGNEVIANVDTTDMLTIVGSVASMPVPEGFVWEILGIEARFNPNGVLAAQINMTSVIELRIPFSIGGVGLDVAIAQGGRGVFGAVDATTSYYSTVYRPNQRLVLPPGVIIRAKLSEASAGIIGLVGPQIAVRVARYAWQI